MALAQAHSRWIILTSFLIALLLTVIPIGRENGWLRPEFVAMLTIYWVLVMPQQSNIFLFWVLGCFQDLLDGVPLGQHAMALMVLSYVCLLTYQRVRNYALLNQSFIVFVLVGLHQLINNWVHSLQGANTTSLLFLLPAAASALLWPATWLTMERVRLAFRVS